MSFAKRLLEEHEERRTRRYKCPEREIEPDVEGCGKYDLHIDHDGYAECMSCGLQITSGSVIEAIWEESDFEGHFAEGEVEARGW